MGSGKFQEIKFSVPWNLFSLTVGAIVYVAGINGIIVHQSFIPGGLYGLCLFISYQLDIVLYLQKHLVYQLM